MPLPSNRSFGSLFVFVFGLLAGWQWYRHGWHVWSIVWAGCAFVTLVLTVFTPRMLTPFNRAWMQLALLLNRIVSPLVLAVMYGVLIVPVGLWMKLVGRDALRLKPTRSVASHWQQQERSAIRPADFKNQF